MGKNTALAGTALHPFSPHTAETKPSSSSSSSSRRCVGRAPSHTTSNTAGCFVSLEERVWSSSPRCCNVSCWSDLLSSLLESPAPWLSPEWCLDRAEKEKVVQVVSKANGLWNKRVVKDSLPNCLCITFWKVHKSWGESLPVLRLNDLIPPHRDHKNQQITEGMSCASKCCKSAVISPSLLCISGFFFFAYIQKYDFTEEKYQYSYIKGKNMQNISSKIPENSG